MVTLDKKIFKNQELVLEKLVNFIVSEYKPERIILFGSYGTEKEKEDFSFAKAGWKESRIVSVTCVLCQQTAEKSLKALLELENVEVQKTLSLKTHRLRDI